MINLVDVTKQSKSKSVLRGITLQIEKGATTLIMGGNGSGKSSLIKILAGLEKFDRGKGLFEKGHKVGYLPQGLVLSENLSALSYLSLSGQCWGLNQEWANKTALELLELFALEEFASVRVSHLDSGAMRKLLIARALVGEPDLLLLDEPFTGLDPMAKAEIGLLIQELHLLGRTIVFTALPDAYLATLADKIVFLSHGEVVLEDFPLENAQQLFRLKTPFPEMAIPHLQSQNFAIEQKDEWLLVHCPSGVEQSHLAEMLAQGNIAYDVLHRLSPYWELLGEDR